MEWLDLVTWVSSSIVGKSGLPKANSSCYSHISLSVILDFLSSTTRTEHSEHNKISGVSYHVCFLNFPRAVSTPFGRKAFKANHSLKRARSRTWAYLPIVACIQYLTYTKDVKVRNYSNVYNLPENAHSTKCFPYYVKVSGTAAKSDTFMSCQKILKHTMS